MSTLRFSARQSAKFLVSEKSNLTLHSLLSSNSFVYCILLIKSNFRIFPYLQCLGEVVETVQPEINGSGSESAEFSYNERLTNWKNQLPLNAIVEEMERSINKPIVGLPLPLPVNPDNGRFTMGAYASMSGAATTCSDANGRRAGRPNDIIMSTVCQEFCSTNRCGLNDQNNYHSQAVINHSVKETSCNYIVLLCLISTYIVEKTLSWLCYIVRDILDNIGPLLSIIVSDYNDANVSWTKFLLKTIPIAAFASIIYVVFMLLWIILGIFLQPVPGAVLRWININKVVNK